MLKTISLRVPTDLTRDQAERYCHEKAREIAQLSGLALNSLRFCRNNYSEITSVLIELQDYPLGNPIHHDPRLMRQTLESILPAPLDHQEEHLRAKSLSILGQAGVTTLGHLVCGCTTQYLLSPEVPQFGEIMLKYVQKQLANIGLSIPSETEID